MRCPCSARFGKLSTGYDVMGCCLFSHKALRAACSGNAQDVESMRNKDNGAVSEGAVLKSGMSEEHVYVSWNLEG